MHSLPYLLSAPFLLTMSIVMEDTTLAVHQPSTSKSPSSSSPPLSPINDPSSESQPPVEESEDERIEKLGRERPPAFKNIGAEIAFNFSICMSQILTEYFVSGFIVIIPTLLREFHISRAAGVWPATAFSLVVASTLLVFGRLGDMWGGYPVYLWGLAWLMLWSLVAGFSLNPLMLNSCRALQGLGAAAFVPAGIMLLGSNYRPGPRKNLAFALYGVSAVLGFFLGILFSGIVGQYLFWGWYFWIGAIFSGLTLISSIFSIPNDRKDRIHSGTHMDWLGTATIVPGLIVLVFAITEAAHVDEIKQRPYIPILFVVGILFLSAAVYVEGWIVDMPLLPPDVFAVTGMVPLCVAMCLLYGTWGIYMMYGTQYFQDIMEKPPLLVVAWYLPIAIAGVILTTLEGLIMHVVPGQILLIFSVIGCIVAQVLLACLPPNPNYWAWIFPSTVAATIGIDLSFVCMTVFVTTKLPKARQGLAGGLINSILQLGIALVLGASDIVQALTEKKSGLEQSYKYTFYIGTGVGIVSLVIVIIRGQIPRAKSELTADDRDALLASDQPQSSAA